MTDREKVINELVEHIESELAMCSEWADGVRVDLLQYAVAMLKEQQPKTGHWVSVNDGDVVAIDNDGFPEKSCFCSECKKYLIASDEYAVYGRFCPFCGVKMEGR